jgi:cell division control protein 6
VFKYPVPQLLIMTTHYLMSDQTLFRDCELFEFDYVPEIFNYRDAQLKDLAYALRPGMKGYRINNTVLRGLPGTGKTTSIHRFFSEIREVTKKLVPVYVSCQNDKTVFAILSEVFFQIHGYKTPALGVPIRKLVSDIGHTLQEKDIILVICLDDAHYLLSDNVLNGVLSMLLRLHGKCPGIRIGFIVTVSDIDVDFSRILEPSVQSIFQPTEIYFPPYCEDEIYGILHDRVKKGLYPGVVSDDILDLIVEKTMTWGDIRAGIDLVRHSVLNAERNAHHTVVEEDVFTAFASSKNFHLSATVKALTTEERELLKHIAELSILDPDRPITTGNLFHSAESCMPIKYSNFYKRLKKFEEMRLINFSILRTETGKAREVMLHFEPEEVIGACG